MADAYPRPLAPDRRRMVQVYRDPECAGHTALNFAVGNLAAHTVDLAGRCITLGDVTTTSKGAKPASVPYPDSNVITYIEEPPVQ